VGATESLPLREDLRGREPYGAPQIDVPVRLNTNESSYPVPQQVVDEVARAVSAEAAGLNRYPDREHTALRADLAAYLVRTTGCPVSTEQVWAGNGSNEVLQHLALAFGGPGRTAAGFTPAYSMHPVIATGVGMRWLDGPRRADFALDAAAVTEFVREHRPDVVFLCSPNNPTGTALELPLVEAVYEAATGVVVVDEAYAEFARAGTASAISLLPGRERLVVTRTMSKAFALAGARLGYLAADERLCSALRLVRLPYHLSSITQAVARAALVHADLLLATVEAIKTQRDRLVRELVALGLAPVPSDANFVMFGGLDDEKATWEGLLAHGVLVRDVGVPGHLRVTAGTPQETSAFLEALAATLAPTTARESQEQQR
jgi:histidinol-phosphate aminotransferase